MDSYELGDYALSLADYDATIKLDPNMSNTYNNRGNTYSAMGEYNKALEDFELAIKISPNYALAYNNRAGVYINLKEYDQAKSDLLTALALYETEYPEGHPRIDMVRRNLIRLDNLMFP